ncbi:MAG: DUF1854 domain-containing protein [Rhodocyclales bacterium]|nr:DUF1854 domain-containing protein [Rhodocyclales bacterium]
MSNHVLTRNSFGHLVLTTPDGMVHEDVVPVRAFALSAPDEGIALVDRHGRELWWLEQMADCAPAARTLIEEALAERDFMPEILAIRKVSTYATPSHWQVDTDRGPTTLTLKSEDDIRRLKSVGQPQGLLIADSHGLQFLIRDRTQLDRASQHFLSRFL